MNPRWPALAKELARADPTGKIRRLISRTEKDRLKAGDMVAVSTVAPDTQRPTGTISGVVLEIRRRGIDSSILVRSTLQQSLGVEWRLPVFSPSMNNIDIVRRGQGYRRNKLFYLRDQPGKAMRLTKTQGN